MTNRRKIHAPVAAIPPTKPRRALKFGEIAMEMAKAVADGTIPRRPFAPPQLPPGVLPRGARNSLGMDSGVGGNYAWMNAQQGYCGLAFPGYTYLSELAQRSEYRSPTETIAKELTREWIKFTGAADTKLKELEEAFQEFNVQACMRTVAQYDGFFGRGQLYVSIKGQSTDQRRKLPLIVDDKGATITKGSLEGFKAIEPIWTTPFMWNSLDPTKPDFYKPDWWYILGKQTHSSRLMTFISRPVPDILKPSYNFSGMSLSQLTEPYVVRWLKTVDSVNRLISNFSINGVMTDMQASLSEDSSGAGIFKRAAMFNSLRDTRGLMLLDKDSEEFFQHNTPLAGLADLQAQAQEHMAAPTHIPLVKLTGITPAGLNASADGEIKVFYDFIAAEQEDLFNAHLMTILKIIQLHLWGAVDKKIRFEWIPLDSPTDKELSEMRKSDGDRDSAYVTNAIVSPDEVRQRLQGDPNSGYTFLKGSAPEPLLDKEHALGQEGAEADAERGEEKADADHARAKETADADHRRAKELAKAKPKA